MLGRIARADHELASQAASRRDGEGGVIRLSVRNELGDDIYSAFVRCRRIVDTMERLSGRRGLSLSPQDDPQGAALGRGLGVASGLRLLVRQRLPVSRPRQLHDRRRSGDAANGCLQVLKGSHRMGRINHGNVGDQTGADPERVAAALERLEMVHCELEPGDAIFFHCNLLHRSDQNNSDQPRWAFICCYNAARNDPYKESRHPRYTFLEKWPDASIKEIGAAQWERLRAGAELARAPESLTN